jgi:hypothetical protein
MDFSTDNLLSDIFDNALDIFSPDFNLDLDLPPLSVELVEELSQPQVLSEDLFSMLLLPEAVYTSATEAEESIQSWAAQYKYAFIKQHSISLSRGWKKYI